MSTKHIALSQLSSVVGNLTSKADERFIKDIDFQFANTTEMNNLKNNIFPNGVTISAGSNIVSIPMYCNSSSHTVQSMSSASINVENGDTIYMTAVMPSNVQGNITYHDGETPKEGNYYYTPSTIYTFDGWKDGNDSTLSSNLTYSFSFNKDISITASATREDIEADRVDAISISVNNVSPDVVDSVSIDSSSNTEEVVKYVWPSSGNVTVNASATDAISGPYYTDDNSQARPEAYMWYIKNKDITVTDETNNNVNLPVVINPNSNKTYSISGQRVTSTVSNIPASYYTTSVVSVSNGTPNGMYKTNSISSLSSTKYYWNNSAENTGYTSTLVSTTTRQGIIYESNSVIPWSNFLQILNANIYTDDIVGAQVTDSNNHNWRIIQNNGDSYDLWYEKAIGYMYRNSSKWSECNIRTQINGSAFYNNTSLLPTAMKNRIITKNCTSYVNSGSYGSNTDDKVWLLSATEIGSHTFGGDGVLYKYFETHSRTVKNENGRTVEHWLRSGHSSSGGFKVSTNGSVYVTSDSNLGVSPAIRVA